MRVTDEDYLTDSRHSAQTLDTFVIFSFVSVIIADKDHSFLESIYHHYSWCYCIFESFVIIESISEICF